MPVSCRTNCFVLRTNFEIVITVSTAFERCDGTSLDVQLRRPRGVDGRAVHALIAACAPLDRNSLYLNLLQCTHFAETCVVAEAAGAPGRLAGFVSGYLLPARPRALFVWQVAVAAEARGRGLARRMLLELLARPACAEVTHLETTITPANRSSWALFRSLARRLEAPFAARPMFDRDVHLDGVHESEELVTVGPFAPQARASAAAERRTNR